MYYILMYYTICKLVLETTKPGKPTTPTVQFCRKPEPGTFACESKQCRVFATGTNRRKQAPICRTSPTKTHLDIHSHTLVKSLTTEQFGNLRIKNPESPIPLN